MKRSATVVVFLSLVSCFASAQQTQPQKAPAKSVAIPEFQAKIEQAWKDWAKKDEKAVGSILADDAVEVWADGVGPRDKKSTLDGMKSMNLEKYALSDFKFVPLGDRAQLARYHADVYFKGAPHPYRLAVSEVWQKRGSEWKLVHYQETEVK
jgi:hypothetical protein